MKLRACAAALVLAAAGHAAAATSTLRVYFNNLQRAATESDCAIVFERPRQVPRHAAGERVHVPRAIERAPFHAQDQDRLGHRRAFSIIRPGVDRRTGLVNRRPLGRKRKHPPDRPGGALTSRGGTGDQDRPISPICSSFKSTCWAA